jgi:hypothetical protein
MNTQFFLKLSMTRGNPFFQQSKMIGRMFQQNQNTNGKQIINGAKKNAPMSMNDIAAQKKEEELKRNEDKQTQDTGELTKKREEFAREQQHERHKLEIEKMLARAKGSDQKSNVRSRQEEPETHKALGAWAGRLAKDLKRLVAR